MKHINKFSKLSKIAIALSLAAFGFAFSNIALADVRADIEFPLCLDYSAMLHSNVKINGSVTTDVTLNAPSLGPIPGNKPFSGSSNMQCPNKALFVMYKTNSVFNYWQPNGSGRLQATIKVNLPFISSSNIPVSCSASVSANFIDLENRGSDAKFRLSDGNVISVKVEWPISSNQPTNCTATVTTN